MPLKTTDLTVTNFKVACLVYGVGGVGKTHFLGTFPKPTYVMDLDRGIVTLRKVPGVEYDTFIDNGKGSAYRETEKTLRLIEEGKFPSSDGSPFKTICLDTATFLQDAIIKFETQMSPKGILGYDGWGRVLNKTMDILRRMRALSIARQVHVVVTCHELIDKDDITGEVFRLPQFQGQSKQLADKNFDEVYRFFANKSSSAPAGVLYKMLTRSAGGLVAKSRLDFLPAEVENPSFEAIMKEWEKQSEVKEAKPS